MRSDVWAIGPGPASPCRTNVSSLTYHITSFSYLLPPLILLFLPVKQIWHGIKGARNSPRGERLPGSLSAIKARAPVLGGNFGIWGAMFSSFDCAVKGYRQKEDPWNAILSGFLTGGCLAARGEFGMGHAASSSTVRCYLLLRSRGRISLWCREEDPGLKLIYHCNFSPQPAQKQHLVQQSE